MCYDTGSWRYSRKMTGTLVGGIAPNSVMTTVTYSWGIASYVRLRRPAVETAQVREMLRHQYILALHHQS